VSCREYSHARAGHERVKRQARRLCLGAFRFA
jgi:hypothetical protein